MNSKRKKPKYLMNGFSHLLDAFRKYLKEYDYEFVAPKSRPGIDFITNNLLLRKYIKSGKIKQYKVVHINNWENILQYNPNREQISIAEAHGFYVGVNFDATIKELPFIKRQPSKLLKILLDKKMKQKLKEYDIFYVATPNMIEHAKKIRKDAKWLPNPINMDLFSPKGEKVKLEGNPAVFLPTRLHVFKNPIFAVNLFKKIKKKYPKAKLHLVHYGKGMDPLYEEFKNKVLTEPNTYIWHKMMPKEELHKYYRSADLVLGQFNENLGNLSLVELEAMCCGAPIVTLDKYELNLPLNKAEEIAFKLIKDRKFRQKYIKRNLEYVKKIHSEKAVALLHKKNLDKIKSN